MTKSEPIEIKMEKKEQKGPLDSMPVIGYLLALMRTYETTFVILLGFQYFNQGSGSMISIANQDYFKDYLKMEPSEIAKMSSITGIPWSFKLIYGIMWDKLPFFGYARKWYIILMGALQFFSLFAMYFFEISDPTYLIACNFFSRLSGAFLDVIVDALMVVHSKVDLKDGSEQLQSLSWGAMGVGGMFSSVVGAFLTQYYHPKYTFLIYSLYGLVVMYLGFYLSDESDSEKEDKGDAKDKIDGKKTDEKVEGFMDKFKDSLNQIKQALEMPEIYLSLSFYILSALCQPQFYSYWYYFKMNVVQFSKFQYAMLTCFSYFSTTLGSILYNKYLKDREVRDLMRYGLYMNIIAGIANLLWVKRVNLEYGISDSVFVVLTDVMVGTLSLALRMMPTMILFAKITPPHLEATCFAFLSAVISFMYGVICTRTGTFINDTFIGVTSNDLSNFSAIAWVLIITRILPLGLVWLIPLKGEIEQYQEQRKQSQDGPAKLNKEIDQQNKSGEVVDSAKKDN